MLVATITQSCAWPNASSADRRSAALSELCERNVDTPSRRNSPPSSSSKSSTCWLAVMKAGAVAVTVLAAPVLLFCLYLWAATLVACIRTYFLQTGESAASGAPRSWVRWLIDIDLSTSMDWEAAPGGPDA